MQAQQTTNKARKAALGGRLRGRPALEEVTTKKTKIAVNIELWDKLGMAGVNRAALINETLEQAAIKIGL